MAPQISKLSTLTDAKTEELIKDVFARQDEDADGYLSIPEFFADYPGHDEL